MPLTLPLAFQHLINNTHAIFKNSHASPSARYLFIPYIYGLLPLVTLGMMKTFHLHFSLLFLFFISHILSDSSDPRVPAEEIIKYIMAKKHKNTQQTPGDGREPDHGISPEIADRIMQNDLSSAAFTALWENDTVALNVLCSHVLVGQNVCAPETCQADLVRLLFGKIKNSYIDDGYGNTPLHYAAKYGLFDIVSRILTETDLINEQNMNGETPLMVAIDYGHVDVAMLLLELVIDVDHKDINDFTSLHLAAINGLLDIVETLLTKTDRINEPNTHGNTPLWLAFRHGHIKIAEMLVNKIANVDEIIVYGASLLHYAARNGLVGIVSIILAKTDHINEPDSIGATPLIVSLYNDHWKIAEMLLSEIANVDGIIIDNQPLLHYAARRALVGIVCIILTKTSRINEPDNNGCTPFTLALELNRLIIAEILINRIGNVDEITILGESLLHYAVRRDNPDLLKMILTKTDRINEPDTWGDTPLRLALVNLRINVAEMLVAKIDNVNHIIIDGEPLLQYAVRRGLVGIVSSILTKMAMGALPSCWLYGMAMVVPQWVF